MTAPVWMNAVVGDFGRGAGLGGLALDDRGVAVLRFETGAALRLEYTGVELVIAVTVPVADVKRLLGDRVYGVDTPSLEDTAMRLLLERKETFSAAESCTGGLIAKRITDIPGSSAVYRGGVTVYTNDVKMLLGVRPETLDRFSAVSRETAVELAENVRMKLGATYGLSVTGVAGPDSDGLHSVGTVFVGLSTAEKTYVRALQLGEKSDRSRIRTLSANHAFDMLRRCILGLPVE